MATSLFMNAREVTSVRVEPGGGDRFEHARGLSEIGRERLLDQHRHAAFDRGHERIDVEMFVGGDDGAGDFRALEQLAMILSDEVGADLLGDVQAAVMVLFGDADPLHGWMARCDLAAKQPDPAGADDGESDAFCLPSHRLPPTISATAESAAFDSGKSTGSLRSAERSAAV